MAARRRIPHPRTRSTLLQAIDELDAIDEVLGALPHIRRIARPSPPPPPATPWASDETPEVCCVDEAIEAALRSRLREVRQTLASLHGMG
ncbi:MAG: hypothetical protein HRU76_13410 [Phycisphaeraceae bacterium]|nr:hypothetical protein [Phycisphaerales bacterium]QOJ18523.1 MAG: hypothetical protein HRU76_13410 [Phycisphaeraceae bacterium]